MKLIRVIEEYRKLDGKHIGRYYLNIDAKTITMVLEDLILNENDYEDEVFDPYMLTENQMKKIYPFLKEDKLVFDYKNNIYELMCYEEY